MIEEKIKIISLFSVENALQDWVKIVPIRKSFIHTEYSIAVIVDSPKSLHDSIVTPINELAHEKLNLSCYVSGKSSETKRILKNLGNFSPEPDFPKSDSFLYDTNINTEIWNRTTIFLYKDKLQEISAKFTIMLTKLLDININVVMFPYKGTIIPAVSKVQNTSVYEPAALRFYLPAHRQDIITMMTSMLQRYSFIISKTIVFVENDRRYIQFTAKADTNKFITLLKEYLNG